MRILCGGHAPLGRGLSRILLRANGKEEEGRGVSSDTLKANMRALFSGVNLLYK